MTRGIKVLPPYKGTTDADWYKGRLMRCTRIGILFTDHHPEYVMVLAGENVYAWIIAKCLTITAKTGRLYISLQPTSGPESSPVWNSLA